MKQLFTALVMNIPKLLGVLVFAVACSEPPSPGEVGGDVKVEVPWSTGASGAELKTLQLEGLESLETLNGRFVQFEIHPQSRGSSIVGMDLKASFIKAGNTYIPRDVLTGQFAAVYAHFQTLFSLDAALGVESLNVWPRKVAVVTSTTSRDRNNAFYDGRSDFFVFVPYTQQQVPLMVNGGVLAHEHFHSLFYKLVMTPLKKQGLNPFDSTHTNTVTSDLVEVPEIEVLPAPLDRQQKMELSTQERRTYDAIKLRALNEGLADYWGYMYSQDAEFLARSLPDFGEQRSLRGPKGKTATSEHIPSLVFQLMTKGARFKGKYKNVAINSEAYFLATRHSRLLYDLTQTIVQEQNISQKQAQLLLAKSVLNTLPLYAAKYSEMQQQEEPSTVFDFFVLLSQQDLVQKNTKVCEELKLVLETDGVPIACGVSGGSK